MGIPDEILSDQGAIFMSGLLQEVYQLLHIKRIRTSPYHPQTDGLVERWYLEGHAEEVCRTCEKSVTSSFAILLAPVLGNAI
jgi:transposase InsO family protein